LIDAGLPHEYWQYAASMAAYIRNRTPTASNPNMASPFEQLWEKKPDLSKLPLFGAKAQVHVPEALRGKLDDKSQDCIFLGYAEGAKAGVFERVETKRRFISRDEMRSREGSPLGREAKRRRSRFGDLTNIRIDLSKMSESEPSRRLLKIHIKTRQPLNH
jgi:hypothetical protein